MRIFNIAELVPAPSSLPPPGALGCNGFHLFGNCAASAACLVLQAWDGLSPISPERAFPPPPAMVPERSISSPLLRRGAHIDLPVGYGDSLVQVLADKRSRVHNKTPRAAFGCPQTHQGGLDQKALHIFSLAHRLSSGEDGMHPFLHWQILNFLSTMKVARPRLLARKKSRIFVRRQLSR